MNKQKMVPGSRPQIQIESALELLKPFDISRYDVKLLGIRGYYQDTMGEPGINDIGIYDDALIMIAPDFFKTFNFNTDPSKHGIGIATLVPGGPYMYKIGMHGVSGPNPYKAFRQAGNVTVTRQGKEGTFTDSPDNRFYIDLHRGGYGTTSSLGCQTVYPDQWQECITEGEMLMKKYSQLLVPYCLVSNQI